MNLKNIEFLKKIKILYVEDDLEIQKTTLNTLDSIFPTIISASNGLEALELYYEHSDFDIIVTDINMPKMNGIELIKEIRKIDSSLPITITTAHTEIDFLQKAIDLNVNGYTLKPINLKKLIETISQAVEARILRKQLEELNNTLIYRLKEKTFELNSILNSQENLVVVSDGKRIHTINKNFLEFSGKKDIEEFTNDIKQICNLFIEGEGYYSDKDFNHLCCLSQIDVSIDQDLLVKMKRYDNTYHTFKVNITTYDFNGIHYVLTLTDITKLKEQTDLLEHQATHDVLTKLANRQKFSEMLLLELNRNVRYNHVLTVAMFDIDYFKKVNDTYGHAVGDEVLINLSNLAKHTLRETDIVSRWGGEEFMILLPETNMMNGFNTIEKLRDLIEHAVLSKEIKTPITCSFGITTYLSEDTIDTIFKRVDVALYKAKDKGRNQVVKM